MLLLGQPEKDIRLREQAKNNHWATSLNRYNSRRMARCKKNQECVHAI